MCNETEEKLTVSIYQQQNVEKNSRDQYASPTWFAFRAGRITTSKFKAAVSTNTAKPPVSLLVKQICYPGTMKFSSAATRWGTDHETVARDVCQYSISQAQVIAPTKLWFFIGTEDSFIDATRDGI